MRGSEAKRIIEQLRKGIPPEGHVRHFTVGRDAEIRRLERHLQAGNGGALLLRANYGSGKSHLLRYIREVALDSGYVVSSLTLDSRSAVRFNRMDQIVGAAWRGLEIPGAEGMGVRPFMDAVCNTIANPDGNQKFWSDLSGGGKWNYSNILQSPALFVAIRAWFSGKERRKALVEDWMVQPWSYQTQRKRLYLELVQDLGPRFVDPRSDWQFYHDGVFMFNLQDYHQSWCILNDLHDLSAQMGYQGVVLLVDEFEDVLTNLKRVDLQEKAFWNLFTFYEGKRFGGMSFFAVTPAFAEKCKDLLRSKERWHFDYSRFNALPRFEMSPLDVEQLENLAYRIVEVHGEAYGWNPGTNPTVGRMRTVVRRAAAVQVQDRARHTIKEVVRALDDGLEEQG